ncbi:putative membrane protein YndM [Bacillus sp. J14TS2]|uniref:YndM family protein n=1 Tax=Bacillus sp. J14TS2 TaxID=2807188 RepID=UPI001B2DDD77|nr:YndM family protein [Bacillus sp. J14TS2]GIN70000.1 putative membrane protein YndM [Bacillus sp. J14TS2]
MDHLKAITIKFLASLALLYMILGMFYGMSFGNVFLITLTLGVVSYLIGDLFILPRTNNSIATAADFGLSLFVIWVMSMALTTGANLFMMSFIAAVGITIIEYFFHKLMDSEIIEEEENRLNTPPRNMQYQTEASEELNDVEEDEQNSKKE